MAPTAMESSDLERWQRVALLLAQQSRQCVELVVCLSGRCQTIGKVCPPEDVSNGT